MIEYKIELYLKKNDEVERLAEELYNLKLNPFTLSIAVYNNKPLNYDLLIPFLPYVERIMVRDKLGVGYFISIKSFCKILPELGEIYLCKNKKKKPNCEECNARFICLTCKQC